MPNMNDIQPKQRRVAAATRNAEEEEDGGWGDTAALLDWSKISN